MGLIPSWKQRASTLCMHHFLKMLSYKAGRYLVRKGAESIISWNKSCMEQKSLSPHLEMPKTVLGNGIGKSDCCWQGRHPGFLVSFQSQLQGTLTAQCPSGVGNGELESTEFTITVQPLWSFSRSLGRNGDKGGTAKIYDNIVPPTISSYSANSL